MQTNHTHKSEQLIACGDDVYYSLIVKRTIYEDLSFHDMAWIQKSNVDGDVLLERREFSERKMVWSGTSLVIEKEKELTFDIAKYFSGENVRLATNLYDAPFDIRLTENGIVFQGTSREVILVPLKTVMTLFFDFKLEDARVVNVVNENGKYYFIKVQTGIPSSNSSCEQKLFSVRSKIVSKGFEDLRKL